MHALYCLGSLKNALESFRLDNNIKLNLLKKSTVGRSGLDSFISE
jgi:hypothetical protein